MTSSLQAGATSVAYLVFTLTFSHAMATTALMVLPAVAPLVALEYGVDPSLVGYYITIVSVGLITSLVTVSNLSRRVGGSRTSQIGHGLVGVGVLLMLLPSIVFVVPGALVIGLGFGMLAPAASALLVRFAPPARRNLVFSIQQTSVPLGGALAAIGGPLVAVTFGWRVAFLLAIGLLAAAVVLLHRGRAHWDDDRDPAQHVLARSPLDGLRTNWEDPRLRRLSLAGMSFCWAQFCLSTFSVVAGASVNDMSLIAAGLVLMVVQVTNAMGRMLAGWIADRIGSAVRVLRWLAWAMLVLSIGFLWLTPGLPTAIVYLLFAAFGVTSGAWAGILMAEVGHLAGQGRVAAVMSGTLLYVNLGKLSGPAAFALIYGFTQSYNIAFALLAVPAALAIWCLRPQGRQKVELQPA